MRRKLNTWWKDRKKENIE